MSGAFVLSLLLVVLVDVWSPWRHVRPFLAVGILGSFTTFSTWMVDVSDLAVAGRWLTASLYLTGSLAGGLAASGGGLLAGRMLAGRGPSAPASVARWRR